MLARYAQMNIRGPFEVYTHDCAAQRTLWLTWSQAEFLCWCP